MGIKALIPDPRDSNLTTPGPRSYSVVLDRGAIDGYEYLFVHINANIEYYNDRNKVLLAMYSMFFNPIHIRRRYHFNLNAFAKQCGIKIVSVYSGLPEHYSFD